VQTIPESYRDIFEKRAFAHVATVDADGEPQVTPVWVDYDGTHILINSARGRKKDRNLRERPQVAVSIQDPDNPYRYIGLQGRVAEITEEGAEEMMHRFAKKYFDRDRYALAEDEVRVIYRIEPQRVWVMG
jgi:PPOX class probable F420-dependent enzyme